MSDCTPVACDRVFVCFCVRVARPAGDSGGDSDSSADVITRVTKLESQNQKLLGHLSASRSHVDSLAVDVVVEVRPLALVVSSSCEPLRRWRRMPLT